MTSLSLPPLSLYIHIPWCVQKCPYSDFNSHSVKHDIPEAAYLARLLDDLRADLDWVQGRVLQSIFIGGGTPSLISAAGIKYLLDTVRTLAPLSPDCEITLEAPPGTVETARLAGYVEPGVTRQSFGVQSLTHRLLQLLLRMHDPRQDVAAAQHAGQLARPRFNLALMHCLPSQAITERLPDSTAV